MDPISGAVFAIVLGVAAVSVVVFGISDNKFRRELMNDPDVKPIPGEPHACRSRREPVVLLMRDPDTNDEVNARWVATSHARLFGARTTLQLGARASHEPPSDVDEQRLWTSHGLKASDEAAARGVLAQPEVSIAVRTLFADALSLEVARDGAVRVLVPKRGDATAFDAKLYVMRVQHVVAMLEAHASAPPVPTNSLKPDAFAAGGATGAPIGVPIGPR